METARRTQSVSLQPVEWLALRRLAWTDERGNVSATVARLLANELTHRLGPEWRDIVAQQSKFAATISDREGVDDANI